MLAELSFCLLFFTCVGFIFSLFFLSFVFLIQNCLVSAAVTLLLVPAVVLPFGAYIW